MRIEFSKQLPTLPELNEALRRHFSGAYSVKTFGVGQRTILVGKSMLIGAEISVHGQEVTIASSPPSVFGGLVWAAAGFTDLAFLLLPWLTKEASPKSDYRALEKEIGTFLTQRFQDVRTVA